MPLYNYRCRSCDYEFTEMHSIADRKEPTEKPCPACLIEDTVYIAIKGAPVIGYSIAPGLKTSDNFNSRLKEIKKKSGQDNTVGDSIR